VKSARTVVKHTMKAAYAKSSVGINIKKLADIEKLLQCIPEQHLASFMLKLRLGNQQTERRTAKITPMTKQFCSYSRILQIFSIDVISLIHSRSAAISVVLFRLTLTLVIVHRLMFNVDV